MGADHAVTLVQDSEVCAALERIHAQDDRHRSFERILLDCFRERYLQGHGAPGACSCAAVMPVSQTFVGLHVHPV